MDRDRDKGQPKAKQEPSWTLNDAALTERARAVAQEYADAQREIVRALQKKLN
jgi:hypothetical protein